MSRPHKSNIIMQTKTSKAVNLFKEGKIKEALRIFKTFRNGFTKEEKRSIEIAYEWLTGKSSFYASLGIDGEAEIEKAKRYITNYSSTYAFSSIISHAV